MKSIYRKNTYEYKMELYQKIINAILLILTFILCVLCMPNVEAKTYTKKQCKQYAYEQVIKNKWTITDYNNLVKLWQRESGWNYKAKNKRSGACGIPQAYPCSKMKKFGKDYKTNCKTQIKWGLWYIKKRYKNPTNAWKHFQKKRWY